MRGKMYIYGYKRSIRSGCATDIRRTKRSIALQSLDWYQLSKQTKQVFGSNRDIPTLKAQDSEHLGYGEFVAGTRTLF